VKKSRKHFLGCILLALGVVSDGSLSGADSVPTLHQPTMTLAGASAKIFSLGVSADGRRVMALAQDNTVREWSLEDGKLLMTTEVRSLNLPEYDDLHGVWLTMGVVETRDEKYIVLGGGNCPVQVRDRITGNLIKEVVPHKTDCFVSDDGSRMALGLRGPVGSVTCISMPECALVSTIPQWPQNSYQPVASFSTTGDAVLLTNPGARSVTLYDTVTGHAAKTFTIIHGLTCAVLSGDKRHIASEADFGFNALALGGIRTELYVTLTDTATGDEKGVEINGYYDGLPPAMAFSPDGKRLAVASAHDVMIMDVATMQATRRFMNEEGMPAELVARIGLLDEIRDAPPPRTDPRLKDPVFLMELNSAERHARDYFTNRRPMALTFTPDGKRLLVAVGEEIQVWSCADNAT